MKLREELTQYLKDNTTGFKTIQQGVFEVEQEDNYRFDARRYPSIEVQETPRDTIQCLSGTTTFNQSEIIITVSNLVNEKNLSSRNPTVQQRATDQIILTDTKAREIQDLVTNLTFDLNGVYLQSSRYIDMDEENIDGDNKKIFQKILTFNCSYNA